MKKAIIISLLCIIVSLSAIDTTRITIFPNEITGEINKMLFGSTAWVPVYDDTGYADSSEYYEFNSKRMAGLWDDSLDVPDTLFKEYFRKTNMNIISIETGSGEIQRPGYGNDITITGRAKWQFMVGGDSDWRDRLYWPKCFSKNQRFACSS